MKTAIEYLQETLNSLLEDQRLVTEERRNLARLGANVEAREVRVGQEIADIRRAITALTPRSGA